jgi:hypothetical protein
LPERENTTIGRIGHAQRTALVYWHKVVVIIAVALHSDNDKVVEFSVIADVVPRLPVQVNPAIFEQDCGLPLHSIERLGRVRALEVENDSERIRVLGGSCATAASARNRDGEEES